jgi:hypothetical protein
MTAHNDMKRQYETQLFDEVLLHTTEALGKALSQGDQNAQPS